MKSEIYLGLDLGGTGVKAGLFDDTGRQIGFGRAAYTPVMPAAGFAEIPMPEIHAAARMAVRMALCDCKGPVRAMAISSQGQTFVALDDNDQPLYPAIMWYDSRGAKLAGQLDAKFAAHGSDIAQVAPIATIAKIQWLIDAYPDVMRRVRRYLLLPDYFAYHLAGHAVMDHNTAASTGVYTDALRDFCPGALTACGITRDQFSAVAMPGQIAGKILPARAVDWGLSPETLIVTGTNDQYAGALGAGNCRPGIVSVTFGTCMALLTLTGDLNTAPPAGIFAGPFPIPGLRYLLAFAKTSGVILDWFQRELGGGLSFDALSAAAAEIPPGSGGITVIPHFDGRISPAPDAAMRGAVLHVTLQHGRAEVFRAILEGLTFCLRENMEHLRRHGCRLAAVRAIGGGAANDFWLQMQADAIGLPVERPAVMEAAVLGAAMLAMSGADPGMDLARISAKLYRSARIFEPQTQHASAYDTAYARYLHDLSRAVGCT